jgi:Insertion element 4 transposase N-terminal/Transposase DDE domain
MPKEPTILPSGVRLTDVFTVTQFAAVFPIDAVQSALSACRKDTIRLRELPNELIVYFVMMLSLFRKEAHREVFRIICKGLSQLIARRTLSIPTPAALSKARTRVGFEPLRELYSTCVKPLAEPSCKHAWFKQWRIMAIDGCVLNAESSEANLKYFGHSKNQHAAISSPIVRCVGLLEVGTHAFVAASIGTFKDGESRMSFDLVPRMSDDMIVIADRNFYSFKLFTEISKRGARVLFRLQQGMVFKKRKALSDGSFLVTIYSAEDEAKEHGEAARIIQYKVLGAKNSNPFFLITNILDPSLASSEDLASLYEQRWEYEIALDEIKTHLNESAVTLRSKTPDLVQQELWGILMTHYVLRRNMHYASMHANLDPDRLSFTHTKRVVVRAIYQATSDFSP